jgi:hypothetical protein
MRIRSYVNVRQHYASIAVHLSDKSHERAAGQVASRTGERLGGSFRWCGVGDRVGAPSVEKAV